MDGQGWTSVTAGRVLRVRTITGYVRITALACVTYSFPWTFMLIKFCKCQQCVKTRFPRV